MNNNTDQKTADAFATSWNNLPPGSIYTRDQFEDWMLPLEKKDIEGKTVLELGCGNAGLMVHMAGWKPAKLVGVDMGDSVESGRTNMNNIKDVCWEIVKGDLVSYNSEKYDLVYSIGVLHHLRDPKKGLDSVVHNTKPGGRFHCWVYAREGNAVIIYFVDPIRKMVSRLPWQITKYLIATPLVAPFFIYAKSLNLLPRYGFLKKLPLYDYSLWIAKRNFLFFRHVAFDQLVTPRTTYLERPMIEEWLNCNNEIDPVSIYIIFRNGNSWKFGGVIKNS